MTIQYHIYSNDAAGGPVSYQAPIATVAGTSYSTPPLAPGSNTTFAVRAFNTASGLEEANVDARVQIVLDSQGNDISGRPAPVLGLSARAAAAGAFVVTWLKNPAVLAGKATGYHVYLGTPTTSYASPAATVSDTGARHYTTTIPGLADGQTYQVAVRAFNAAGEENNTFAVSVTARSSGPSPVDGLSITGTFQG
jgi:hypothetical protein